MRGLVTEVPCAILEPRLKPAKAWVSIAAVAALFVAVCAPTAMSQAPAAPGNNPGVESAARARPLTIPVPKPKPAASDPEPQEGIGSVQVTSDGNLLMIQAKDCALSEILDAVRAKTGATIDIAGRTSEHMTVKIGPGPARQVISSLLGWTDFDYVIQGADGDSVAIQSIMLFPKTKSSSSTTAATPALGPSRQPLATRQHTEPEPSSPPAPAEATTPPPSEQQPDAAAPAQQPTADAAPVIPTQYDRVAGAATPDPTQGPNGPKSTSEMITDMQQLFQQRQQIQANHNSTPGSAPLPSH